MSNIIAVSNETNSSVMRMTRDGRKLFYEMKVLQQPQRARACGSGAKSSADRRPVDPPPVVELKVLEGDAKTDITFSHNANFFLYVTLEPARPIAQTRGNTVPTPLPVLTGMPVAGMAYLDRPSPAGYFIFPDLSVRHEGKYRLSFNLFEELKEAKDADAEGSANSLDHANNHISRGLPMAPQAFVHFRLEVKSEPFSVFSAKKFPGLAESTPLSRVVAEQGCRVRIRRDVRMRRRDNKGSKEYDDYDDDASAYGRERYQTPDNYAQPPPQVDRARSVSNVSHASGEGHTPYAPIERRPSNEQLNNFYQQAYQQPTSVPQSNSNGYTSHLSFGGSSAPQYQAPAPMPQPPSSYLPNSSNYAYQPTAQPRQSMSVPQPYTYPTSQPNSQPYQQHSYSSPQPYSESSDNRRSSYPQGAPAYPTQQQNGYSTNDAHNPVGYPNYYPSSVQNIAPRAATPSNVQQLPPLKTIQHPVERKHEQPAPASAPVTISSTHSAQSSWDHTQSPYGYSTPIHPPSNVASVEAPTRLGKRSFGSVFDTKHMNEAVHNGARPSTARHGQSPAQIELDDGTLEDEEELPNLKLLSYRRADGSRQHKKCPSPIAA